MIEKRQHKRVIYNFNAEISHNDRTFPGVIDNISENGICIAALESSSGPEFPTGASIEVTFTSHSKEDVTLSCLIKWVKTEGEQSGRCLLGLKIIDPPWETLKGFI